MVTQYKPPYPRRRTRLTPRPLTSEYAWYNVSQATGQTTYSVPWTKLEDGGGCYEEEVMDDIVTPGYREIRARGGIVNTAMSKVTTVTSGSDAGWKFQAIAGGNEWYGEARNNYFARVKSFYPMHRPQYNTDWAWLYDNLLTEMVTQLRAKVNASTAQLAVSLGEMGETMRLLARPTQGLGRILKSVMLAGGRKPSRTMSDFYQGLENLWLTARYGWRPIMIDIEKFLEAYGESRWKLRDRVVVKRVLPEMVSAPAITRLDIGSGFGYAATASTTTQRTLVMGNFHELDDPTRTWQDLLGVRLQDMPLAAWNLIPFSFVVDWFVNVSHLLGTLASYNTKTLAEWFITEDREKTVLVSGSGYAPTGWVSVRDPNCTLVRETVVRTRRPYLPKNPGLAFRQNSVRQFFQGDLRNLDALALLTTSFRTGRIPALRGVR